MLRFTIAFAVASLVLNSINCDTNYRLQSKILPESYSIVITPYFDTGCDLAFTFDGEVTISVATNETDIKQIKLHSQNLQFTSSNVSVSAQGSAVALDSTNPIEFDDAYSFLYINLEEPLQVASSYDIIISYRGNITDDLKGFYRSYFFENGVKKWLGVTQMSSVNARKVFPCFDEPQYKATFTLTIDRPPGFSQSLTNTKLANSTTLENGYTRDVFTPSPKMSTYLVAFLISEFESADGNYSGEFEAFSRPNALDQTSFAMDYGQRALNVLNEYFGLDYYSMSPNMNMHYIAVPDFTPGAMENWGLITYKDVYILFEYNVSTTYYQGLTVKYMSNTMTHMWLGNLVTAHWWSDIWLSEGLSAYFQEYLPTLLKPDFGTADLAVIGTLYDAYELDQIPDSLPIKYEESDVNSPEEIDGTLNDITSKKAATIIRMLAHLIGDEAFQLGLQNYIQKQPYGVADTDTFYDAIQSGVDTYSALEAYSGASVANIMNSWISQPGYPVVQVNVDYETGTICLNQTRFYWNSSYAGTNETYKIPVSYTTALESDFINTTPSFIFENETYEFAIESFVGDEDPWVIFNLQETGFYRVNYDTYSWGLLAKALQENRESIHHLNRAKIINDLFAFYNAELVDFALIYDVIQFLKNETEHSVWYSADGGIDVLRKLIYGTEAKTYIDEYFLTLMEHVLNVLGFKVDPEADVTTRNDIVEVWRYACKLGHQGCIDSSVELFQAMKNGDQIHPDLFPMVYCYGVRYGDADDFDWLYNKLLTTNAADDAILISIYLGCTRVEDRLRSVFQLALLEDSPIRAVNVENPIYGAFYYKENAMYGLELLQNNYTAVNNKLSVDWLVSSTINTMYNETQYSAIESWLDTCEECSEEVIANGKSTLHNARAKLAWAEEHAPEIVSVLSAASTN